MRKSISKIFLIAISISMVLLIILLTFDEVYTLIKFKNKGQIYVEIGMH